ncbi:MAG: glycosyltransferase [Acidobacteriota bacterium]
MRVFHFISYSADVNYLENLGKGLSRNGIHFSCATLFGSGAERPGWMVDLDNANYYCLNAHSRRAFPLAVLKLARILRRLKPDIVHTHLYEASLIGLLAAKASQVPLTVMTRHHSDQAHMAGNRLAIAVDRFEARIAHQVIVPSFATQNFLIEKDKVEPTKVSVIHLGFDFDKFSSSESDRLRVRKFFSLSEKDFVIGNFGNFYPTKGHRFLISAAREILDHIPNLKLLFVGDGGAITELKQQIKQFGLEKQVIFAGNRTDVPGCMNAVDVVVHPSLSEAFSQVIVEAMAVGTPLISTDVGGAREVISHGENAILIRPGNSGDIVRSVKRIYMNRSFASEIAAVGQQSVRERFTIDKMLRAHIRNYETWLSRRK